MKILILGSGGREHALAKALAASPSCGHLFAAPGNPGIAEVATLLPLDPLNAPAIIEAVIQYDIRLVVIGPEAPLAAGVSDALRHKGVPVFGPSKAAAQMETSKSFAKEFMVRHAIPTARYAAFGEGELAQAAEYCAQEKMPLVIKADGLAAGKGVTIAHSVDDALAALRDIYSGTFGEPSVVIEEFMEGVEVSLFAVSDGTRYLVLPSSQDHKRAFDNDRGPNTGGMGAYAPAAFMDAALLRRCEDFVLTPTIKGLKAEGIPFVGCLYAGLMIKNDGMPYVVEFNARFGDPETQAVMSLIEGDVASLFLSAAEGNLQPNAVRFLPQSSCAVVLVSAGYPGSYPKGFPISGINSTDAVVYHAGTAHDGEGNIITAGGRVLAVVATGNTLAEARQKVYAEQEHITFEGKFLRSDIALKGITP